MICSWDTIKDVSTFHVNFVNIFKKMDIFILSQFINYLFIKKTTIYCLIWSVITFYIFSFFWQINREIFPTLYDTIYKVMINNFPKRPSFVSFIVFSRLNYS